ncbi:MAG: aldo/keto reductase, partial [Verrucomicrobia bacterium]
SEQDAIRLTHAAMDMGINFIDTANVYEGYKRFMGSSGGVAETILGKALKGRRDRVVLATKGGSPLGPGPQDVGLTPTHLLRALDDSLRRLQTDWIDLYIIHWPDPLTPLETTLGAIEVAMKQGKIRAFGVSNHYAWQLCELLWIADRRGWPRVVSSQIPYSMLRREFHNDLAFCQKHDIAVTPYQVLQGGLLTGKYRRDAAPEPGSRLAEKPQWVMELSPEVFDRLEAMEALAAEAGLSMTEYTVAWTLAQPAIESLVVGATRPEQIEAAVRGAAKTLPAALLDRQDKITPPPHHHRAGFSRPV